MSTPFDPEPPQGNKPKSDQNLGGTRHPAGHRVSEQDGRRDSYICRLSHSDTPTVLA